MTGLLLSLLFISMPAHADPVLQGRSLCEGGCSWLGAPAPEPAAVGPVAPTRKQPRPTAASGAEPGNLPHYMTAGSRSVPGTQDRDSLRRR